MAIKINNNTIIDDGRNIVNAGIATISTLNVGTGGTVITTSASGFVGVNTTNPQSTLAVGGTITELFNGTFWNVVTQADVGYGASQVPLNQYLGQLAFLDDLSPNGLRRDGGGSDDVNVDSNGNVGVGTTNPATKLEVNGTLGFSGNNIKIGNVDTGTQLTSFAIQNILIGPGAGDSITTGDYNTIIGPYAGYEIKNNVASNVIIGLEAGREFKGSQNNVILGTDSAYRAGNSVNASVVIGYSAGFEHNGFANIILGESTAWLLNGNNNVIMGYGSGYDLQGDENVILGYSAGVIQTTGTRNVYLGSQSGINQQSGSNNIAIGYDVDVPILTGSNQLAIGVGANRWIVGNSSYNVGIGTTNPTSKLTVIGSIDASSINIDGQPLSINNLDDVDTTTVSPSTGDILTWDGSSWVPNNPNTQSLPAGTLILAHLDGTNGSTYTVEDGPYSRSVATINGATLSTSNSKFGGSSLQLNGSSHQGISISPPEAFGTGDFSIDLWVYYDGTQPNSFPTICNLSEDLEIGVNASNGGVYASLFERGTGSFIGESWTGAGAINNNLWNHIAVQCASGTTQLWVNGIAAPSFSATLDYTAALLFGTFNSSTGGLNGYIDEIRITNTAPYTIGSNFTPPTSAYT